MKVTRRTNTATIVLDFDDVDGCIEAMHFIKDNCDSMIQDRQYVYTQFSTWGDDDKQVQTSKIKIIKLVRAYGQFVKETKTTGLKSAKEWVEKHEKQWEESTK
tara:strand:- start:1470 stop:1778 length:309 start_codon:yes stop_codon:yes gene_type:complete